MYTDLASTETLVFYRSISSESLAACLLGDGLFEGKVSHSLCGRLRKTSGLDAIHSVLASSRLVVLHAFYEKLYNCSDDHCEKKFEHFIV